MLCTSCGCKTQKSRKDYKYTESGLDNVILKGVGIYECPGCGETLAEIRNIAEVHKIIAFALVKKDGLLVGAEVRFLRKQMGLNEKDFADLMGVDPVSVSRWENSKAKLAVTSDKLIRMLFIQFLEEECNQVAPDTLALIRSVSRSASKKFSIQIPYPRKRQFCLSLGK